MIRRDFSKIVVTLGDIIDEHLQSFSEILPIYSKLEVPHHIERIGIKSNYYSELLSGWPFIYLDGTEESLFRSVKNSAKWIKTKLVFDGLVEQNLPQAQPWNGGISEVQMGWLQDELEKAQSANEHVIICNH